jgi:8-oxo-dGTP pyrophosphatase MutT (NUDIX family)
MSDYGNITMFSLKNGSFKNLEKIQQVYGIILNQNNQMLIVLHKRGDYLLIGGRLEENETLIQCLNRECLEEANITLKQDSIKEAFYQEVIDNDILTCIQVRYIARLEKELGFDKDPDESIISHKWIEIDEIEKFLNWGESVNYIKEAINNFK